MTAFTGDAKVSVLAAENSESLNSAQYVIYFSRSVLENCCKFMEFMWQHDNAFINVPCKGESYICLISSRPIFEKFLKQHLSWKV